MKNQKITSVGENVEKLEPSYITGGNVKWCSTMKNYLVVPHKAKHRITK